jgi:hypothetical protein
MRAFITSFELMKNAEIMTTDLTNWLFSHYLIDLYEDLNDQSHITIHTEMKNIDLFTYVMISDRYIFEKFMK